MKFEDMINTIQLGDCYELIKKIPDKSIDCIYVDVPYYYESGGSGSSDIAKQISLYAKEELKQKNIYDGFDTKIYDSYLLTNVAKQVEDIINKRVDMGLETTRTLKSYIRETKAHNRLYKLGLFRKHTRNCDLEENIKWWKEIIYFIIGV